MRLAKADKIAGSATSLQKAEAADEI